jgi:hypothetical protein
MAINWERSEYESRVDVRADEIESFIDAVLGTIDVEAARTSPDQWEIVCRYFAGCARAASMQGNTRGSGGKRIATHLAQTFPGDFEPSNAGFFEFMDWLSNPEAFRPSALRSALE